MTSVSLVSLVNRPPEHDACRRSLLAGGDDRRLVAWHVIRPNDRGWNASRGLNAALEMQLGDWVVFVHQDVRFPPNWIDRFTEQVSGLAESVAVVGVAGATREGAFRGHLVDPNGHCHWPPASAEVLTLDECLLAVRGVGAPRFDEAVPGFHCYGAELCLRMAAEGRSVRTVDAPVLHLSTGRVDAAFETAARYLLEKWGAKYRHYVPATSAPIFDPKRAGRYRRLRGRYLRWRSRRDRGLDCNSPACIGLLAGLRDAERT
jgi:hypothetical protein